MVCPFCNSVIPDGSGFCANCGNFITTSSAPKAGSQNTPDPEYNVLEHLFSTTDLVTMRETKKVKTAKPKGLGIVVAVVLALLFVAATVKTISRQGVRRAIAGLQEPIQEEATGYTEKNAAGYEVSIYYKYSYEVDALVVSSKHYIGFGLADRLAPVDVAFAWGDVAANNETIDFNWKQSGRWVHWKVDNYADLDKVGGIEGVNMECSNNHLIPADNSVKRKIKKIKRGDHIKLTGYLVDVDAENKAGRVFTWNSSTTRLDSGDGACEVIYVTDVVWR